MKMGGGEVRIRIPVWGYMECNKKDSSLWLCVDFWGLNKIIKKDHYPLPQNTDLLESPYKARSYSKIDLRHHLPPHLDPRGWQIENCFLHSLQIFWIVCHAFRTYQCPCCFSVPHEQHLLRSLGYMPPSLLERHPDLFWHTRRTLSPCLQSPTLTLEQQALHLWQ